jgi:hypothetical protein
METLGGNIVRTVADELFDLVKERKKISVEHAAKLLKMPVSSIQSIVDFLVEEKVFGIEYKFTTPFIYLYKEGVQSSKHKKPKFTKGLITKDLFYERAKSKGVLHAQIEGLWRKYLQQNMSLLREEFIKKSREKKIPESKVEDLWNMYLSYL